MQQAKASGRTSQIAQNLHLRGHVVAVVQQTGAFSQKANKSCRMIQGGSAGWWAPN